MDKWSDYNGGQASPEVFGNNHTGGLRLFEFPEPVVFYPVFQEGNRNYTKPVQEGTLIAVETGAWYFHKSWYFNHRKKISVS